MPDILSSQDKARITESLLLALEEGKTENIQQLLKAFSEEDIAEILETTPPEQRNALWDLLPSDIQGEVIGHLNDEVKSTLLNRLNTEEIAEIAEDLETDEITDLAQSLDDEEKNNLLNSLEESERQAVEKALTYPEDTAGGLMSTDIITVREDVTVEVVLRYLRKLGELPENTHEIYVQDRQGHYVGTVPITKLLTTDTDTPISDIVDRTQPSIKAYTPAKEVAHLFEKHDLLSAAVVDDNSMLLGRVTIDDVVDIIREEAEHAQMASAGLDEDEDLFAPPAKSAKRRTFWLGVNLLTAVAASMVIGLFDGTIEKVVALAVLMPIIASMGGIAGTQTATIVIRAIATGKLTPANSRALLFKELMVGVLNGLTWALLTGVAVAWLYHDVLLAAIFGTAMIINLIAAALAGALIPLILKRLNIDPALASGLLLTTVTDTLGFFVFLGLATVILLHQ
jgi:magnesium transporter